MTPLRYLRNQAPLLVGALLIAGCGQDQNAAPTPEPATQTCTTDGHLSTRLYGAIEEEIHFSAADLACEGMPRPEGRGARLRFSGPLQDAPDGAIVALIFGIPDLTEGATALELPTNVTLVQEGAGRFFGTAGTDGCWTDIRRHDLLATESAAYTIAGSVYCVSPLAELNGNASVTFTELSFSGRISWELPE